MNLTGVRHAYLSGATGLLAMGLAFAAAAPANATDDLADYQGEAAKGVVVTPDRDYDEVTKQTTFTFELALKQGETRVSHVLLISCPDIQIVRTSGPSENGQITAGPTAPEEDGSIKHSGIKFDPGFKGVYTVVFAGNIAAADFVVKDGNGHKHYPSGADVCKPVTTSATTPTTVGGNTTETTTSGNTTPTTTGSNPGTNPASNQPSQPGTEVQGVQQTNNNTPAGTGTNVLSNTQSQPEALAALPRTGTDVGLLASIGVLLAGIGSVARTACRRH